MDINLVFQCFYLGSLAGNVSNTSSMSIIETTDGMDELSRINYFECRPIKYEHIYGFGLNTKLQARVVIAYGWSEVPTH